MVEVLERGDIRFFFWPTVQPADLDDWAERPTPGVQSFFVVLSPAGGSSHRRVRVGRKRMPVPPTRHVALDLDDESSHALARRSERFWCRVERVGTFERVLGGLLEDETYTTKTRGDRYQPAARPIAHGCYAFVRHDDHTHLVYRIEHAEDDDIPDEVRVPDAASNVILFENTNPTTRRRKAVWTTDGDPDLLDHEGEELVLVGVDDNPERELGIEIY